MNFSYQPGTWPPNAYVSGDCFNAQERLVEHVIAELGVLGGPKQMIAILAWTTQNLRALGMPEDVAIVASYTYHFCEGRA